MSDRVCICPGESWGLGGKHKSKVCAQLETPGSKQTAVETLDLSQGLEVSLAPTTNSVWCAGWRVSGRACGRYKDPEVRLLFPGKLKAFTMLR